MPWYDLTVFKRTPGGPGIEQRDLAATFEAADDDAARNEGYRRFMVLPPDHFAALYRTADARHENQIGAWT